MLEYYGWETECESPHEVRHGDGSFAKGQAVYHLIQGLHEEYFDERNENFNIMIDLFGESVNGLGDFLKNVKELPINDQKIIFNSVDSNIGQLKLEMNKLQMTLNRL